MLPERVYEVLQQTFGFASFRRQQQAVVEAVLAGDDALVIMPTGGGKSLCYQLPAICLPGVGVVVSPLIALMADQVAALTQLGVRAAYLNSTQDGYTQSQVVAAVAAGELDLLYVAPERLLQPATIDLLQRCDVGLIAIDEAHCVSSWGHDFRTDYLDLAQLGELFPGVPRLALTATADERTRADIVHNLDLRTPSIFIDGFDRPNIYYQVTAKTHARSQLLEFLAQRHDQAGIVYCLSRRSVEATAEFLCGSGFDALPYHAGLDAAVRMRNQERFLREDGVIVVATIAFGMGIDKPDVRFVAHLDLPKSLEAYYQETGRAGRDGEPAHAWMVYGLQDVVRLSQMLGESQADAEHKRVEQEKLNMLLGWCEVTTCRRAALLAYFDDALAEPCTGCDVCDIPPDTFDGTQAAQKFLSCVVRTGQRFGAGHVIDVLRGSDKARVQQLGHTALPTFGIGKEFSDQQWRSVVRQLVAQGLLYSDAERHGALRLSSQCRPLLRGERSLQLRRDLGKSGTTTKPRQRRADADREPLSEMDEAVFEELRELRKRLATEQGVPPYVIFHDAALRDMVRMRPTTDDELLAVPGVGAAKLSKYGQVFLAELATLTGQASAEADA